MNTKIYLSIIWTLCSLITLAQDAKKVLIIGIDGCRADVLQLASTPNIDGLIPNSIYSYHALNDDITFSGPGWSAMMTGVWSDKHGVTNNAFTGSDYNSYPHFIKRVEDYNSDLYTVSISQWHPINNSIVLDHADYKYNAPTEADVTSEAIDQLENEDPDVMFLHYDEVDHAGHAHEFSQNSTDYTAAIEGVDTQIGLVLDALYARPNYNMENWLILVSTDHGGLGSSHGGTSIEEETIFYIAHNKNIAPHEILPDTMLVVDSSDCIENEKHLTLDGDDDMINIPHFTELDFGANQDFTIECRVKTTTAADVAIVGNKNWDSGSNKGFVFSFKFANGPEWKMNIGDGSNRVDINTGGAIADNEWHHLAVTFDRDGQVSMYEDGILLTSIDMSTIGDIDNNAPFRIGADINGGYDYTGAIEEVRIWNSVLAQTDIDTWKCSAVDNTHPSYSDLVGYWPLDESSGTTAHDLSTLDHDGTITNPAWSSLDSIVTFDNTPRITDVAVTAMNWLCIDVINSWSLDGMSVLDSMSNVQSVIDGNLGSLRSTIANSCPEDSLYFDVELDGNDHLLTREIEIPHNLTILGSGIFETSISSNFQNRAFLIPSGISLELNDMTIHQTKEIINGGAIYNLGNLTLKNIIFKENFENVNVKAFTNDGDIDIKNVVEIKD